MFLKSLMKAPCERRYLPVRGNLEESGDCVALAEFGAIPGLVLEDVSQHVDGVPHVGVSEIERSDTEPQHSWFAVVADDAPRDESLHDGIALGMNKKIGRASCRERVCQYV